MIGQDMVDRLYDCQVVDPHGEKIGSVRRVWLDGRTGDPAWAEVHTGLFGMKESFVPLQRAELREDKVTVPVGKAQVKDAPRIDADGDQMSDEEQQRLYRYYGVSPAGGQQPGSVQRSPSRSRDDDDMVRSEERLRVGTEQVETGRVRLVKHVVTEQRQMSVPVSHEEVHVEREPITDGGPAEIAEDQREVRLHAEKPVVSKETVPMERVRLSTDTVTDEETVSDQLRKEEIDVQDDRRDRRR